MSLNSQEIIFFLLTQFSYFNSLLLLGTFSQASAWQILQSLSHASSLPVGQIPAELDFLWRLESQLILRANTLLASPLGVQTSQSRAHTCTHLLSGLCSMDTIPCPKSPKGQVLENWGPSLGPRALHNHSNCPILNFSTWLPLLGHPSCESHHKSYCHFPLLLCLLIAWPECFPRRLCWAWCLLIGVCESGSVLYVHGSHLHVCVPS